MVAVTAVDNMFKNTLWKNKPGKQVLGTALTLWQGATLIKHTQMWILPFRLAYLLQSFLLNSSDGRFYSHRSLFLTSRLKSRFERRRQRRQRRQRRLSKLLSSVWKRLSFFSLLSLPQIPRLRIWNAKNRSNLYKSMRPRPWGEFRSCNWQQSTVSATIDVRDLESLMGVSKV